MSHQYGNPTCEFTHQQLAEGPILNMQLQYQCDQLFVSSHPSFPRWFSQILIIYQDNCTTPCFREGLSQLINVTQNTPLSVFFQRVRRTVEDLKNNKCSFFTCEQPCNQTTASNTVTFLRSLLGTFQKEGMRERKGRI
ncbi:interleukin-9 isoform X3 [Nannospalax galili]|uniref:interleukin-9 isoform X3 n=1 Tax=Nannospalax galili TaxID=1026970 RepID=UPI00111C7DF2|nr:interleukin-9 isoform X3 [Nannospalax galili]